MKTKAAIAVALAVALCGGDAQARALPGITEVEAEIEFAYFGDIPSEVFERAMTPTGWEYSVDATCRKRPEKRWGCALWYQAKSDEGNGWGCEVAGRAWMTREGLKTWRSKRSTCGER